MKHFTKTLVAAALFASAGAANASIQNASTTGANEAFLVVYDSTQKLTFDLDLGSVATFTTLSNAITNKLALHYDLSNDANWKTFAGAGFNAATTQYGVVVAKGGLNFMHTSTGLAKPAASGFSNIPTNINNDAGRINNGLVANTSLNVSKLVADVDAAKGGWAQATGSANTLNNIWGSWGSANAAIAYGATGNFFQESATSTAVTAKLLGGWTLSGNSLDFHYSAPAAVPLPAAVWMFGAGLMGMLRLSRRKSAAV